MKRKCQAFSKESSLGDGEKESGAAVWCVDSKTAESHNDVRLDIVLLKTGNDSVRK